MSRGNRIGRVLILACAGSLLVQAWALSFTDAHAFFQSTGLGPGQRVSERFLAQTPTNTPTAEQATQEAIRSLVEQQGSITGPIVGAVLLVLIVVGGLLWASRLRR